MPRFKTTMHPAWHLLVYAALGMAAGLILGWLMWVFPKTAGAGLEGVPCKTYLTHKDTSWNETGEQSPFHYGINKVVLNAKGLEKHTDYTLIEYPEPAPNPWLPGGWGIVKIASGNTGNDTNLTLQANYQLKVGAKYWLVLSSDLLGDKIVGWNPIGYLFEHELIPANRCTVKPTPTPICNWVQETRCTVKCGGGTAEWYYRGCGCSNAMELRDCNTHACSTTPTPTVTPTPQPVVRSFDGPHGFTPVCYGVSHPVIPWASAVRDGTDATINYVPTTGEGDMVNVVFSENPFEIIFNLGAHGLRDERPNDGSVELHELVLGQSYWFRIANGCSRWSGIFFIPAN